MKSKKFKLILLTGTLALSAVASTGCSKFTGNKKTQSVSTKIGKPANLSGVINLSAGELRERYVDDDKNKGYVLLDPIYNQDRYSPLKFKCPSYEIKDKVDNTAVDVYIDLEEFGVEKPRDVTCLFGFDDTDDTVVVLQPSGAATLTGEVAELGDWGPYSKIYLVFYMDYQTGEAYDIPRIQPVFFQRDLTAPTVTQSIDDKGNLELNWEPVEGADYYDVYLRSSLGIMEFQCSTSLTNATSEQFDICTRGDIEGVEDYHVNDMIQPDDTFFVIARSNDGKESGFSNIVSLRKTADTLPSIVQFESYSEHDIYSDSILDLPTYTNVETISGNVIKVLNRYRDAEIEKTAEDSTIIRFGYYGLDLPKRSIVLHGLNYDEFNEQLNQLLAREDSLLPKGNMQEDELVLPTAPKATDELPTPSNEPAEVQPEATSIEHDIYEHMYASSAIGEWLAVNMLNQETAIPLADFDEANDPELLLPIFTEAYKQNPLIGVITDIDYNFESKTLLLKYEDDADTMKQKQKECLAKSKEIVSSIIKDGMSDFEKEEAINNYLVSNAVYDEEILEAIKSDGSIDESKLAGKTDDFTPYGVLINGKGVCESYAESFLLLAQDAGLNAVIDRGKLSGVNHEWCRVEIDGNWTILDVTNNDNEVFPNWLFNVSTDLAGGVLTSDSTAMINMSNYEAKDESKEYYTQKGLLAMNNDEAVKMLGDVFKPGIEVAPIRLNYDLAETDVQEIAEGLYDKFKEDIVNYEMYLNDTGVFSVSKQK